MSYRHTLHVSLLNMNKMILSTSITLEKVAITTLHHRCQIWCARHASGITFIMYTQIEYQKKMYVNKDGFYYLWLLCKYML